MVVVKFPWLSHTHEIDILGYEAFSEIRRGSFASINVEMDSDSGDLKHEPGIGNLM